jgi:tetratricopeptide (TPR) repeat protein
VRGQACFGLGTVYAKLDDPDQAYHLLKEATDLDDGRYEYWQNFALTCIQRLRPYEAERAWRKCLQLQPCEEVLQGVRSALDVLEEQTRSRIAANPKVTHEALETQERLFDEGVQAIDRHDIEYAAEHFRQCVAIDPMHYQSWGNLGMTLLKMGRLDEGECALKQALELNPDYQFARFNLESLRRLRETRPSVGQ